MKIAIAVPLPNTIPQDFPRTLTSIISYTKSNLSGLTELHYVDKSGVRTDRNRNIMLEQILERGIDYVLWLDVDMIYPPDIICKYMEKDFDVMGCLYFKRAEPFVPIGYIKGDNPKKPYKPLDPRLLPENTVIEVDALGFGGMMVNTKVYKTMGDDKWMRYSDNFYLPYETDEPKFTHDILFCRKAQEYGAKIMLHTGVKPAHMGEIAITQDHWAWMRDKEIVKKVAVVIPTIRPDMAKKALSVLKQRAGSDADYFDIQDINKKGYISICNDFVKNNTYDYYCFLSDDIFPSRNWLKNGLSLLEKTNSSMLGFNDGKWFGNVASFSIVKNDWLKKNYGGDVFFKGYNAHYADMELTLLAVQDKVYKYDGNIVMCEIDYEKDNKGINLYDKELFMQRKKTQFDGRITDKYLLKELVNYS